MGMRRLLDLVDSQKSYRSGWSNSQWVDENGEGRCTVGIWFKPLQDDVAHSISKKYQLYKG